MEAVGYNQKVVSPEVGEVSVIFSGGYLVCEVSVACGRPVRARESSPSLSGHPTPQMQKHCRMLLLPPSVRLYTLHTVIAQLTVMPSVMRLLLLAMTKADVPDWDFI